MTHQDEKHPIVAGLVALASVAVAVGLLLALFSVLGSRVLGLGGSSDDGAAADGGPSLYLPTPVPTGSTGAASASPSATSSAEAGPSGEGSSRPARALVLQAASGSVAPMARIDLSGTYDGGEGAVLQVQRKDGAGWQDFPVTTAVSGGSFSTYVQTGRTGVQRFRVKDTASGETSNAVKVRVG